MAALRKSGDEYLWANWGPDTDNFTPARNENQSEIDAKRSPVYRARVLVLYLMSMACACPETIANVIK